MESPGLSPDGRLPPCPDTPNCVCSDAPDGHHYIAPLETGNDPAAVWRALLAHLQSDRAYTIIEERPDYLRAEARTRWLRFVDDVEFRLHPEQRQIAMRSASRVGYSDLGANRRRLEALRNALGESR